MNITDTFTSKCPWGCTVHTVRGVTQPHTCEGTSQILDLMRVGAIDPGQTFLQIAERLARGLDPVLRERLYDSWVTGVHDGRKPGAFYGVDGEQIATEEATR